MVEKIPNQGRVPHHQLGSARLAITLAGLDFPVRREALIERNGSREIEIEDGLRVPLGSFFERSNVQDLKSLSHAMRIAEEHWANALETTGRVGAMGGEPTKVREGKGKPKSKKAKKKE